MGGTNDPSNLVELTVEEHAEAHRVLWEKYGAKEDWLAWQGLAGIIGKEELLHQLFVHAGSKSRPPVGHKANLGKKWTQEHKDKISLSTKGKPKTEEHSKNISKGMSKEWIVIKPTGEQIRVINLNKYCLENNLNMSKMSAVALGKRKHHKGHLCQKLG